MPKNRITALCYLTFRLSAKLQKRRLKTSSKPIIEFPVTCVIRFNYATFAGGIRLKAITDLWKLVLKDLEEDLSAISIATWFDEVVPVKLELITLYLYCPNSFKQTNIERFYMEPIRKSLRRRFSNDIHVCFVSDEEYADFVGGHVTRRRPPLRNTGKFTFDSFVVGDSNRVAYNAAQAVAAGFDEYCNPLVIYGNPGLGKTHLLNAIAFAVSASEPDAQVVCIKGDEFTNELVGAIRDDTNAQFRDK